MSRKQTARRRSAPARRGRGAAASEGYEDWLFGRLRDPGEAAEYLEAAIDEADQAVLMLALRQVAHAQGGVAEVARRAKLTREATYRMLSKRGNPELRSFKAILAATGLRMSIKPLEPKRGRRVSKLA